MLIYAGRVSLYGFLAPFLSVFVGYNVLYGCGDLYNLKERFWWIIPLYYLVIYIVFKSTLKDFDYESAVRGLFLGCVFSVGCLISLLLTGPLQLFGWYLCLLSFFHWSEFMSIALANPTSLNTDSYMLNHSRDYKLALFASWTEFFLELYFFPGIKRFRLFSWLGLCLCLSGELVRKLAILTASRSFTHLIQWTKSEEHKLVTSGVYSLWRHPSYVGWFYWAIATQLVVLNPVCLIAYTFASWYFFYTRIQEEEVALLYFYSEEYVEYQRRVPTGLPFIKGYILD